MGSAEVYRQSGFQDTSLKFAPKRIIICCDGTWQSSVTNVTNVPSNVTQIARYLLKAGKDTKDQVWQQVVYYDAGIGTGVTALEANIQGSTGTGFVGNVIEAYNFIVLNYNPGDQVFCIGFSRGAYTARAVAGLVTDIGIIKPRDMQDFAELYRVYQDYNDGHTFRKSKAWREWVEGVRLFDPAQKNVPEGWKQSPHQWKQRPHGAAPESTRWVEAVGVFDTVGSLGVPEMEGMFRYTLNFLAHKVPAEKFGFHNVTLSPYIKHAYHAMALDEHRKPFDTTMWHLRVGDSTVKAPKASIAQLKEKLDALRDTDGANHNEHQKAWEDLVDAQMFEELKGSTPVLRQVWFPGVHINIGGGSDDLVNPKLKDIDRKGDFEQIAMITLSWMVEQLKAHLAFELNAATLWSQDRFIMLQAFIDRLLKDRKTNKDHWLVKKIDETLAKDKTDPWNDGNQTRSRNVVDEALQDWGTGPIIDSFQGEMKKAGSKDRSPGRYIDKAAPEGSSGETNEAIHPTVWYRIQRLGQSAKPKALNGFEREQTETQDGISYEWVKDSIRIPEWKIRDQPSIERSCLFHPAARQFLGSLDKEYGIDSWEARGPQEQASISQNQGFQPNSGF